MKLEIEVVSGAEIHKLKFFPSPTGRVNVYNREEFLGVYNTKELMDAIGLCDLAFHLDEERNTND